MVHKASTIAVVAALAPICVEQFRQAPQAASNLIELQKALQQGTFVEKGGWSLMPGSKIGDRAVADACAALLIAQDPDEEELSLTDRQPARSSSRSSR